MLARLVRIISLATVLVLTVGTASAEVVLRYAPADTLVESGTITRLSIMCDEVLDLRTIEVFVQFDSVITGSVAGGAGTLFTDSGFNLFKGFELTGPEEWHGYCVILGSGDYITGPGELFYWDFEGLDEGVSPIITVSVDLAAPDATVLPDVTLPPTTITVGDPLSAVGDVPVRRSDLRLWPNPFNPRTEIVCDLERAGWMELAVFDVRGYKVVVLHDGSTPAGLFTSSWDGLDSRGLAQPGGVYLFRMSTSAGHSVTKGVLLK